MLAFRAGEGSAVYGTVTFPAKIVVARLKDAKNLVRYRQYLSISIISVNTVGGLVKRVTVGGLVKITVGGLVKRVPAGGLVKITVGGLVKSTAGGLVKRVTVGGLVKVMAWPAEE